MLGDVVEINRAGERAADLTRQLLAFSRQQVLEPKVLDLNAAVGSMEKMLRRLVGEDIDLRMTPGDGLGRVKADPGHIEQVIMNLVVNARDAMPDGGTITIETANVQLDDAYAQDHLGSVAGPHVMIAVSDTGSGMDKATQEHIFEPFFTTKEKGKGTGLGLSTVFGIVKQSGGSIWVYSELNHGTTFKVYLPRTDEVQRDRIDTGELPTLRGGETILVVEDDEQVRTVTRGILKRNGYNLIEARNGAEALRWCEGHDEPIDLLLTDVVMPEMSGRQLSERLGRLRPGLKVLFMSGYTEDAILHHRVLVPGIALLQKPLTPETLLRKVRSVLDAKADR
jgi:CheY-like chemotaxis protein